jgi:transposase
VHRVRAKAASDYAEIFDGVPAQHDGTDAAVVAELAAQGRSWPWPLILPNEVEQEMAYQVDWLEGQRRQTQWWYGRLEALLSRHGPEATALLPLTSGVLRRTLVRYGGPRGVAEDGRAAERLYRWGKGLLSRDKAEALVASARQTAGVSLGRWDEERLRRYAQQVQDGLQQHRQARRRRRQRASVQPVIQSMGEVVGTVTACVLWVELGNPQDYPCGAAYRKAMGLKLKERSSGRWQGQLRLSKRGPSVVRRWLYLAALRWLRQEPVRSWYLRQKAQRRGAAKPALVGVMRKLALALYRVGGRGEPFDRTRLYRRLAAGGTVLLRRPSATRVEQRKEATATKLAASARSSHLRHSAARAFWEHPAPYRGARTEAFGVIFEVAPSMVAAGRYIPGKSLERAEGRSTEEVWLASRREKGNWKARRVRRRHGTFATLGVANEQSSCAPSVPASSPKLLLHCLEKQPAHAGYGVEARQTLHRVAGPLQRFVRRALVSIRFPNPFVFPDSRQRGLPGDESLRWAVTRILRCESCR